MPGGRYRGGVAIQKKGYLTLSLFLIPLFLLEHSCQSCELFLFLEFSISCCSGSLMTPEKKCLYESFKRKKNDRPSKWSRFSQKHFSRQLSRGVFQWSVFFFLSLSVPPDIHSHSTHTPTNSLSLTLARISDYSTHLAMCQVHAFYFWRTPVPVRDQNYIFNLITRENKFSPKITPTAIKALSKV